MKNCEGYIKFNYDLEDASVISADDIKELEAARKKLYAEHMIGMYENGIGFGNISMKHKSGFIISGSATGKKETLNPEDYCYVDNFNINFNYVHAIGKTPPSSESMTHAAVYSASNNIGAVFHIHHEEIWMRALEVMPASSPDFAYGTRELAFDIQKMLMERATVEKGIIIMAGHPEGMIVFGSDIRHALRNLEKLFAV